MRTDRQRQIVVSAALLWSVGLTAGTWAVDGSGYRNADLPELMEFLDGTPVRTDADLERRKQEIRV